MHVATTKISNQTWHKQETMFTNICAFKSEPRRVKLNDLEIRTMHIVAAKISYHNGTIINSQ